LYLVDRAGRRLLLILGGLGMGLFTGLFALLTSSAFDYEASINTWIDRPNLLASLSH
jgi:hypothetical protein